MLYTAFSIAKITSNQLPSLFSHNFKKASKQRTLVIVKPSSCVFATTLLLFHCHIVTSPTRGCTSYDGWGRPP